MVEGCGINNGAGQVPHSQEARSDFAMVGTEHLLLNLPERNGLLASERMDTSIQIIVIRGQDHLAEIMDQSGGEGLRSQRAILGLEQYQVPRNLRHTGAVLPYFIEGQIARFRLAVFGQKT